MNEKMLEEIHNVTHIVKELQNSTNVVVIPETESSSRLHFLEKTN
jgi:hypothetical protein